MAEGILGSHEVICQKWEETERGWGQRPDGFSLHLTYDGLGKFLETYWGSMPDQTPGTYSRPCGEAYLLGVNDEIALVVESSGDGLRFDRSYAPPGSGGIDGWLPLQDR